MRGLTHRSLFSHGGLETFQINFDTSLGSDIRRDVERETVRVVQRKGVLPAQTGVVLLRRLDELREHLFAATERLLEAQLLALELGEDSRRILRHLRIALVRHGDGHLGDGGRKRARAVRRFNPE